jgi:hypothetical protein
MSLDYAETKAEVRKHTHRMNRVEGVDFEDGSSDLVLEPSEVKVLKVKY